MRSAISPRRSSTLGPLGARGREGEEPRERGGEPPHRRRAPHAPLPASSTASRHAPAGPRDGSGRGGGAECTAATASRSNPALLVPTGPVGNGAASILT